MKEILKKLYRKCVEYKLWFLFIVPSLIILFYGGILIYMTYPISEYSISKAGQFGDSFGILNSLFSGLAFISLIITIKIQQKEMKDTKEEMFKQNFENTFFKLFEQYNNQLVLLKTEDTIDKILSTQYNDLKDELVANYRGLLKNYFMFFYQILQYINDQENFLKNKEFFNSELYISVIKATLDDKILILLLLLCNLDNFNKFKILIEKYNFLEDLNTTNNELSHIIWKIFKDLSKYKEEVFGNNEDLKNLILDYKSRNQS